MQRRPVTRVQRNRHPLRALAMPVVTAAFLGYFGYHAFTGAFGIWSMESLQVQSAELSVQLADLRKQRQTLEANVRRLRPDSVDADLVDSSARAALNLMRPDEVVLAPAAPR